MIIDVVGLGLNPRQLCPDTVELIREADVLAGGSRQLDAFPEAKGELVPIGSPVSKAVETIRARAKAGKRVMVLADGDPLFYGIGKRLARELGSENLRIHPGVTTLQTAAARLGLPWHDLRIVSLHGRGDFSPLFARLTWRDRVGVFTDEHNTPGAIARALMERGAEGFGMWIFEDLESDIERVGKYTLAHAAMEKFSTLNFVVLERMRSPEIELRLGIDDDELAHEKGLITKGPVRAAGLASLAVAEESVVWDVGAGCGAVSLEAAFLARQGAVFAVEKSASRVSDIETNIRRCGAWLVRAVQGEAPECLAGLPDPDRIFLGGGLSKDTKVLEAACARLKPGGRITAHVILLDTLSSTKQHFAELGWPMSITQVLCSRSKPLAGSVRMEGMNPVFILAAEKPGEK